MILCLVAIISIIEIRVWMWSTQIKLNRNYNKGNATLLIILTMVEFMILMMTVDLQEEVKRDSRPIIMHHVEVMTICDKTSMEVDR